MRDDFATVFACDREHQALLGERNVQRIGTAVVADRLKIIAFDQIVDRNRALVLDVRIGAADRLLVEFDRDEPPGRIFFLLTGHRAT
jgi:hypothetical protein